MIKPIDMSNFKATNSEIALSKKDIMVVKFSDRENSGVVCTLPQSECSEGWLSNMKYLIFDAYVHNDNVNCCFLIDFWEKDHISPIPDFFFILGVFSKIRTKVIIPLDALTGNRIFLDRIPGALKILTHGKNVDISKVDKFGMRVQKSSFSQRVQISNLHFSDKLPGYSIENIPLIDEFGQWKNKEWDGKIHSEQELQSLLSAELDKSVSDRFKMNRSKYGGWTKKQFDATGYFRTQFDSDRWWMVDPDGCAFFSAGLDCVRPDESSTNLKPVKSFISWLPERDGAFSDAWGSDTSFDYAIANLIRVFGSEWYVKWTQITKNRLADWGFNTVANWSDRDFMLHANIPYVYNLKDFPKTQNLIFRDFPDVFSNEYLESSKEFARQLEVTAEDPYMIGYFLSNEPNWAWGDNINIAEDMLNNPLDFATKDALILFLSDLYSGDIKKFNHAWNTDFSEFSALKSRIQRAASLSPTAEEDLMEFSKIMIHKYCEIPSTETKKVDPHHLNLGMRYASIPNKEVLAGCDCFDVFSMNCYKIDPSTEIEKVMQYLNMPIMIGEYHFGALDKGLPATGLRAVTNQTERGLAYQYYLQRVASMKNCVGAHYFTLNDQAALGRSDGENYQIGFVNVCGQVYDEFVDGVIQAHSNIYEVAAGMEERYDLYPDEIDWIAY